MLIFTARKCKNKAVVNFCPHAQLEVKISLMIRVAEDGKTLE